MKILLTGATGFIGKNLSEYLNDRYILFTPTRAELDLLDTPSVDAYLKQHQFDVVIHSAGKPGHRNAVDPTGVFYADTRMFFNLVRNRDYFGKLLITGSGGIYDFHKYRPKMKELEWRDNIPIDEHGFFRYVTAHHIETLDRVTDLRLFGVFGKHEDYTIRFISNAICKALLDLPITIRQNRFFDYLCIEDLYQVVEHFLTHEALHSAYNVTPDSAMELLELAEVVRKVSRKDVPIMVGEPGLGPEYSGDNGLLRRVMPSLRFTPITEAIECLYGWYRSRVDLIDRKKLLADK